MKSKCVVCRKIIEHKNHKDGIFIMGKRSCSKCVNGVDSIEILKARGVI